MVNHLHRKNQDLETNWNLRNENYDKNILLATILHKFEDFGVLQENPMLFKYQSDIWWAKHYRTFEKWFDAFDIPYAPLENYNRKEESIEKTSEEGNTYNRFSNKDSVTDHHIGDTFSNEDLTDRNTEDLTTNQVVDQDTTGSKNSREVTDDDTTENIVTQEVTDLDTTGSKTYEEDVHTVTDGTKNYTDKHVLDGTDNKTTTSNGSSSNTTSNSTTETSGKLVPVEWDDHGNPTDWEIDPETERTIENRVSAYNEGEVPVDEETYRDNYSPNQLTITHGQMSTATSGRSNGTTSDTTTENGDHHLSKDDHTYDESHEDETQVNKEGEEHTTGTEDKTVDFTSDKTGTDDKTVTYTESSTGTMDQETDFTSNKVGTDTRNIQNTSNDKYINNSDGKHTGDSQSKNNLDRSTQLDAYLHGNIGVTTSQQMLNAEIRVQLFSIYDQIAELFVDENCVCIFNTKRGGCCWW